MTKTKDKSKATPKAGRKRTVGRTRRSPAAAFNLSVGRVMNLERAALLAGDTELAAAIKLAGGLPLGNERERAAAVHSGMFGNVFAARFDSAQTTPDNAAHWQWADGMAADSAASPGIRYVLRNRSRYEAANNSYCRGMIGTIATDMIGTGPRLQMETGDDAADEWIEAEFSRWCRSVRLVEKLRTMTKAKLQDGEAIALQVGNPKLPLPVKIDLRIVESDRLQFVDSDMLSQPGVDGIVMDAYGNPVEYHILRVHPGYWGYGGSMGAPWEYDKWPANLVMHWFQQDRPEQHRGLPETLAALPLFAQLRRYTLAVLQAAETAADFALWMKTPLASDGIADDSNEVIEVPNPFDLFPLQRNIVTTLPDGYDIGQTRAEQPTTTHEMFVRTILREIARCLRLPYSVAAGDSSQGNYSSGNLDWQNYFRLLEEARKDLEYQVLDAILAAWLYDASQIRVNGQNDFGSPYMPAEVRQALGVITREAAFLPTHTYNWVGHEWANPMQAATADETNLRTGCDTYARVWGRKGQDYRKAFAGNAKALGLTVDEYREQVLIPNLVSKGVPAQAPEEEEVVDDKKRAEPQDSAKSKESKDAVVSK